MENVNRKPSWVRGSSIGRGSFGTVNLAVDKSDGQVFAVKSVDLNSALDSQIDALENEIIILRSISSPYVVNYLGDDVTFEPGRCRNLHMEYLPGGTGAEVGKISGADEMSLRSYTWCIASALRDVHTKGIVHCDVKGRNVLVGSTPGTAKLADFGSAAEMSSAMSTPRGSPLWMAPEVIRGEYQGPESDVWSLGCTFIEMITGKPAWEDRGSDTILKIGYSNELPKLPAQLSELGRDFLEKCLRRSPSERWSCDQLLHHPFLLPHEISHTKWSPRCVFDWSDSNFSDEDDEAENLNSNAKGRIGKLASTRGANWESDGWLEVRNLSVGKTEEVDIGTNSVYPDLMRTDEENATDSIGNTEVHWRANWECYSESNATSSCSPREANSEHCSSSGGASSCAAGSSCTNEDISFYCFNKIVILLLLLNLLMYQDYTFKDNIINKQRFTLRFYTFLNVCWIFCNIDKSCSMFWLFNSTH